MAATTLHTPGQNNATGDTRATFKTVFSGLLAHQFEAKHNFAQTIVKRSYPKGYKSLELKYHDASSPIYHVPGQDILRDGAYLENVAKGSKDVPLGAKLVKADIIDDLDRLMQDFDSQRESAKAIQTGLRRKDDELCIRAIIAAAARNGGADEYTAEPDLDVLGSTTNGVLSTVLSTGTRTQKGDALKETVYLAKETLDEADVPDEGRIMAVRPSIYTLLLASTDKEWINRDWADNNGSLATGKVMQAAGFTIIRSSNIPTTDLSGEGSKNAELDANFANTIGMFYTEEAAVRALALDVKFNTWYENSMMADVYSAAMAGAYGSYRRECAIHWKET